MNRPQLYEIRVFWYAPNMLALFGEKPSVDSINRYARDDKHAEAIGRKFARETLKAGEIESIKLRVLSL